MKKMISLFLITILAFSLFGCNSVAELMENIDVPATAKTFTVENLSIDLTDDFFPMDFLAPDCDFCISSEDIVIFGYQADFAEYELYDVSLLDYAHAFRDALDEPSSSEISQLDSIPIMHYESQNSDGEDSVVYITFHQASDRFWILNFIVDKDDNAQLLPVIEQYAKSVRCE